MNNTIGNRQQIETIFTQAHNDYQKALSSRALYKVNDKNVSEDIVQDTFMKTWMYLVRGGKIELMKAFLFHVLNDLVVDEYRKRKNLSLDTLIENGFELTIDDTQKNIDSFDAHVAVKLISKLPTKYQKVLTMKYVQDMSLSEISIITGDSKNTIAVQLHRGLSKLKDLYNQQNA